MHFLILKHWLEGQDLLGCSPGMKAGVYYLPGSPSAFLKPTSAIIFSHSQGCHLYTPASGHFLLCYLSALWKLACVIFFLSFFLLVLSFPLFFPFLYSPPFFFLVSSMFALLSVSLQRTSTSQRAVSTCLLPQFSYLITWLLQLPSREYHLIAWL